MTTSEYLARGFYLLKILNEKSFTGFLGYQLYLLPINFLMMSSLHLILYFRIVQFSKITLNFLKEVLVGLGRLELPTSRLSGVRSNLLSYRPIKQT